MACRTAAGISGEGVQYGQFEWGGEVLRFSRFHCCVCAWLSSSKRNPSESKSGFQIERDDVYGDVINVAIRIVSVVLPGAPEVGGFVVSEDGTAFIFDTVVIASIFDLDVIADTPAKGVSGYNIISAAAIARQHTCTSAHTVVCPSADEFIRRRRRSKPPAGSYTCVAVASPVAPLESAGGGNWSELNML